MRVLRIIKGNNGLTAKIMYNRDWNEYIVRFFKPDYSYNSNEDYYTDDRHDAIHTAEFVCCVAKPNNDIARKMIAIEREIEKSLKS